MILFSSHQIIKQYRRIKPDSDRSTNELLVELERKLSKAPFIARVGDNVYYLYYIKTSF